MSLPRFFVSPITEPDSELGPEEARHAAGARRVRAGDEVELFDGRGRVARGRVEFATGGRTRVAVLESHMVAPPGPGRITLAVSIAKGERFDWLIEKCTELGVDRIIPVRYERTVKQARGEKVVARYERLALAAAKQSGRAYLPEIAAPMSLEQCLALVTEAKTALLYGSPAAEAALVRSGWRETDVAAFVGPEGGFTSEEQKLLDERGARAVRLTRTVLRVETAAVAFAAVLANKRDERLDERERG